MRRSVTWSILFLVVGTLFSVGLGAAPEDPPAKYDPPLAKASDEAEKAIPRFKLAKNLKVEVWAAEPMLAHPVAFAFDEQGRCYVAETFRHSKGATDNRSHMNWLEDELAARTVADRVAMFRKYAGKDFSNTYEKERDRVRLLVDSTGSGKADKSTVFSDDFGHAEDGIGAGLLARHGNVYYTCIPDLWLLKDTKGTGSADVKQSLSTGYGVHVAFIGHDLHGLRIGPDGKLYFTCGDRGLNVKSKEGKHHFYPDTGAVMRCDLDGSNLEVVHIGLRNPQELAFDEFGNLFTVDNNSDAGDQARWVHLVEGGDSGWRLGYQYGSELHDPNTKQGNRGPWHYEKLWHTQHEGQAAYILPPLKHFSAGPSGFCSYPGIGLAERYSNHFFLCDFRGGSGGSGVWSFAAKPKGASFEMVDDHQFIWSILATDCDFGPDGGFYISDWVEGWNPNKKGRIYKFTDPEEYQKPAVAEAKKLLAEGFEKRAVEELAKLLEHPHQQVRMESQFALAAKGKDAVAAFAKVAESNKNRLARLHAIWGLGMMIRKSPEAGNPLLRLVGDKDEEVRAQTAKLLGDVHTPEARKALLELMKDATPRVQFFAANSLGKSAADTATTEAMAAILKSNNNQDRYLRHAAVMGLRGTATTKLVEFASDPSPAVRLGAVLALRQRRAAEIRGFLHDPDPSVVLEAVRAIHDEAIADAIPDLATMVNRPNLQTAAMLRVLNAQFRLGKPQNATALATFAARADATDQARVLAVKMLGNWEKPTRRDYITGLTQDLGTRDASAAANAFRSRIGGIFSGSANLRQAGATAAGKLGIKEVGPFLLTLVEDDQSPTSARVEGLRALESLKAKELDKAIGVGLGSRDPRIRNAARGVLVKTKPDEVFAQLKEVMSKDNVVERQGALALLADIKGTDADALIEDALTQLIDKKLAPELALDAVLAAEKRDSVRLKRRLQAYELTRQSGDDLAKFRETLFGGDAENGRRLFLTHAIGQCQRCHKLDGEGGEVGPLLNGIAAKQKRDYLLEALVLPNKQIAKGYETVRLRLLDGRTIEGSVRLEDGKTIRILTAEAQTITVLKEDIEKRTVGKSAMPEDLATKLTKPEIRDLVEFLAELKVEWKK